MIEHLTSEQLYALSDGMVTDEQRNEIEAHIAGCELCAAELALLGRIESTARSLPLASPSAEFTASVMARIQGVPSSERAIEPSRVTAHSSQLKQWSLRLVGVGSLIALYVWFLLSDEDAPQAGGEAASGGLLSSMAEALGNGIAALIPHLTGRNGSFLLTGVLVIALLVMVDEIMKGKGFRPRS